MRSLRLRLIEDRATEAWPWLVFGFWKKLKIRKTERRESLNPKDRERRARR